MCPFIRIFSGLEVLGAKITDIYYSNKHNISLIDAISQNFYIVFDFYIYKALFRNVSQCGVLFCDDTHTHRLTFVCVCVVTQTNFCLCVCVCRHTSGVANRGEGLCERSEQICERSEQICR